MYVILLLLYVYYITSGDEIRFKAATSCHICGEALDWNSEKNYPVRDHDHYKSKDNFRGAAHR